MDARTGPVRSSAQLRDLRSRREPSISARCVDGRLRDAVPIRVVVIGEEVLVRSRYPRDTGWYGAAVRSGRARVEVVEAPVDVAVERTDEHAAAVDDTCRAEYGAGGSRSVITSEAVSSTLRLVPGR